MISILPWLLLLFSFIFLWINYPFSALFILLASFRRCYRLITALAPFFLSSILLLALSRVLVTFTFLVLFLFSIILVSDFSLDLHIIFWILLLLEHEMFSFLTVVNLMITMVISMAITMINSIVFINVRGVSIVVALMVKVLVMMLNVVKHVG